jgi:hypothetical protein
MIHRTEYRCGIVAREESRGAQGRLDIRDHERRGETFAAGVSNGKGQAIVGKRQKVIAIAAQGPKLPTTGTVTDAVSGGRGVVHKALLDVAGGFPVLTYVHYHGVAHFLRTSVRMSVLEPQNRHGGRR